MPSRSCSICNSNFDIVQKLKLHKYRVHGIKHPLRCHIVGNSCLCCLKYFHTRNRVLHHLKHPSKHCHKKLLELPPFITKEKSEELDALKNLRHKKARKSGQPEHFVRLLFFILPGPLEAWAAVAQQELQLRQEAELSRHQFPETIRERLIKQGTKQKGLCQLFEAIIAAANYDTTADEVYSTFLDAAYSEPQLTQDVIASAIYWYNQREPICFAQAEDGFGQFLDTLIKECDTNPFQPQEQCSSKDSTARRSKASKQPVATSIEEHDVQHHLFITTRVEVSGIAAIPDFIAYLMPTYIVLHLFSGRKRHNDLQAQLEYITAHRKFTIITLSLDLAVHEVYSNLADKAILQHWITQVRNRLVIGIVAGPPCKTWSAARHNQLYNNSPPPLRSEQFPWGLDKLDLRQY